MGILLLNGIVYFRYWDSLPLDIQKRGPEPETHSSALFPCVHAPALLPVLQLFAELISCGLSFTFGLK